MRARFARSSAGEWSGGSRGEPRQIVHPACHECVSAVRAWTFAATVSKRRMRNPDAARDAELLVELASSVRASSEQPVFPIGNAIDGRHGPGGSRWIAAHAGAQTVTLAFDRPESVRDVSIECEEHALARTQDMVLSLSRDGGATYDDLAHRKFTFAPYGPTFERETWAVAVEGVTHLRLRITPDVADTASRGGGRASLTSLVVR
jgi:hypothetical protein